MSLESILNHILDEANIQRDKIIQEAKLAADKLIQEGKIEADELYREVIGKEKVLCLAEKQKLIVHAHLESRKNMLLAKQELIDSVFNGLKLTLESNKFKKQQVSADKVKEAPLDVGFYLKQLRQDYETEIAKILF